MKHYCSLLRKNDSYELMEQVAKDTPGLEGFLVRETWRSLEVAKGIYDLSEVERRLDWCEGYNMKLILQIEDKTFGSKTPPSGYVRENPLPDYLAKYVGANSQAGLTALRWNPYLAERYLALLLTLAKKFDDHPALRGIMTMETAPSMTADILDQCDYDPLAYLDVLKENVQFASRVFPKSEYYFMQNYLPRADQSALDDVVNVVETGSLNVVFGGPDLLREDGTLQLMMYPRYRKFPNQPSFITMSMPSYSEWSPVLKRSYTLAEQRDFAEQELGADEMHWTYHPQLWPQVAALVA